ncbi:hypothetical protein [Dysgonomonas sp. Marseille-P4361]|uniref:hypothetical protein n=1 Tax=Dysgonomonas sp. Marseille-P4361 TaxID=2161820 RepID=UPI000D55B726|nr:hypothetical protein [Dysgonomonas sp. Marseille-P4361]
MRGTGITVNEETGDLNIKVTRDSLGLITGGLVIGDVQMQNQAIIIYMHPGEMKEKPTVGVGVSSMLLSSDALLYKHKIREQLEADGFRVNHLEITNGQSDKLNIEVNAQY